MAERIIDHTWYEFLPILGWIVDDAAEAGRTLEQAARDLEEAAHDARRIAAIAYGASDAAVRRLLGEEVYSVLDLARDRVAALRSEQPVAAAAAAEPLRPNRGLLFNVDRGLELLLASEPSEQAMRYFSLRDPRWMDHHVWYPGWLADVTKEVKHALRGLSRAQSELEPVYSDVAAFLAEHPTSSGRAAPAAQACAAASRGCTTAAGHARRGAANMGALIDVLQGLHDDILDEPPTGRVRHFFGYVPPSAMDDAGLPACPLNQLALDGYAFLLCTHKYAVLLT